MNFGILKDTFLGKLIESYVNETEDGKLMYKKFLKALNENEILRNEFIVYKNIEEKKLDNDFNASMYIRENVSLFKDFTKKEIVKANKLLADILKECGVSDFSENKPFYESLHNLICEKKTVDTLDLLYESFNKVKNFVLEDKISIENVDSKKYVTENVEPNKFLEIVVKKYNEKYNSELNEEEKLILKVIKSNDIQEQKNVINQIGKETIGLINKHLKENGGNLKIKEKLLESKDVIYEMFEGNNEDLKNNILKLYELKTSLQ